MPEMHLRQPQLVYSACGPFTRHKERIKEFKRTGDARYIYRNELDKACFQHDSAYADHKDLINRTKADKVLRDKAYNIASNPKYDGYQRGLASMVYKFFDKKSVGSGINMIKSRIKLIIEEEDMQDIIKIIKELENSDILLKGVSKTIENEIKEQRGGFLSMLLGTLGASLLGNLLTGKGIIRASDGIVRAGEGSKKKT